MFRDKHLPRALMFFSQEGIKGSNAAPTESHGLNCYSCCEEHWRRQWLHHACNIFRATFKNVLKLGSEDLSTVKSMHHLPVFQTPLVQCCIVWETRVLIQSLGFGIHDQLGLEDASVMFAGCSFMGQLSTKPSCLSDSYWSCGVLTPCLLGPVVLSGPQKLLYPLTILCPL